MIDPKPTSFNPPKPGHAAPALESRVDELRAAVRLIPPTQLAEQTSAAYLEIGPGRGELHIPVFGSPVKVSYPALEAFSESDNLLPGMMQAMLLYHFLTADGTPLTGKWVSFADLPGGRMYSQAFQGYTGDEVVKTFDPNLDSFRKACEKTGGRPLEMADAAYVFLPLPRVPVVLTYWLGDEDFPSSCKVLFDASACNYLPIDGCAILGSMLTGRVMKAGKIT